MAIPKYDDLFNPLLQALHELGGSASVSEQEIKVAEILKLTEDEINEIHRGNRTKLAYRLAWARNYLKRFGLIENSARGVWSLTQKGNLTKEVNKTEVNKIVKTLESISPSAEAAEEETVEPWREELLSILKQMDPIEFERLCQRILRESGFDDVIVTKRSGDGGIDGRGTMKVGTFLSFRIAFQCKRYQKTVSSPLIREFRGSIDGTSVDKGLFITTAIFTKDARDEAYREGAIPIELIDGEELLDKMKELGLGVKQVTEVDKEWFKNF